MSKSQVIIKIKKMARSIINFVKLPVMIPIGMVLNSRKKRLSSMAEQSDSIGVLGRGTSLAEADRLNFLNDFIIVNTEPLELKTEPVKSLLKNKRIIHMVNIGEGVLPAFYLLKYKIYKYVIARLKPDGSEEPIRTPREIYQTEKFGFKTDLLPEEMNFYLEGANNAGVIAVAYAATGLKKKNVYVVGIDFYETSYLTGPLNINEPNLSIEARDKMISYITKLISECPKTNFHFITASTFFSPSLPNLKITRLKRP